MVPSMSRRGNCHDNAVAESFFSVLKKERVKRRIYPNRATAASDVFDCIEMFYNPIRCQCVASSVRTVLGAQRRLSVYGTLGGPPGWLLPSVRAMGGATLRSVRYSR